jgi:nicotinamide phosphoribosyltransferase
MNPLLLTDGYKVDHKRQYPDGTTLVYSNWTPRKSRIEGIEEVVFVCFDDENYDLYKTILI